MTGSFHDTFPRVTLASLLSRARLALLALLALHCVQAASAHEVRPAVADVEVTDRQLRMEVRLALEAIVAGIDLSEVTDTNDAPEAEDYDRLRALVPDALEERLRALWPRIGGGFRFIVEGEALQAELVGVAIPEVGDVELARDSTLSLTVALPDGTAPVEVGWDAAYGPLVVRQVSADEEAYSGYLTDGALSEPLPRAGVAQQGMGEAFLRYIVIGFEHIVPKGLDHILFVAGLFFFSLHLMPMLAQVTAFTLAHSVTLALAILGAVSVPAAVVEPLIAASIVFVGIENLFGRTAVKFRTAVVFCFGLLHGLGFASVLGEIGLDPGRFITGLIGFNIGVEFGQLSVIAALFLGLGVWFGKKPWYRARIANPASIAIAAVGSYWFVERVWL